MEGLAERRSLSAKRSYHPAIQNNPAMTIYATRLGPTGTS